MDDQHRIEQRLMDLEVKASFTEDLLDQLNAVVVRQQQEIAQLARELAQMRQDTLHASAPPGAGASELPPHY
jgi:SlyX protein